MTAKTLLIYRGPCSARWQLGPPCPNMLLIGWAGFPGIDCGAPEPIAKLLATALTSTGHVSYLAADKRRILDWLRRLPRPRLATSDTLQTIVAAFDEPYASWSEQSQVFLGTPSGFSPPTVPVKDLYALLSDNWCEVAMHFPSVTWALRPGVDGDVAGLCSRNEDVFQALLDALERSAVAAGLAFEMLDEAHFTKRLSDIA